MFAGLVPVVCTLIAVFVACGHRDSKEDWGASDYAWAGMPDVARPWTVEEHARAAEKLAQIAADGHTERLPRYHGARSGAVFARMIEPTPDDPAEPIAKRWQNHKDRFGAEFELWRLYKPKSEDEEPNRESVQLSAAGFRELNVLLSLIEPYQASLPTDDPKHDVRMQGVAEMWSHWAPGLIDQALVTIGDNRIAEADRLALLKEVRTTLSATFPKLAPDRQAALRKALADLQHDLRASELRDDVSATAKSISP